jgi:hypothetical protein
MVTRPQTMQGTMQLMPRVQKAWKGARLAGGQKMRSSRRRTRMGTVVKRRMGRLQRRSGGSGRRGSARGLALWRSCQHS